MISAGVQLWSLGKGGEESLGLCCTEDGLFLGRTPLIERCENHWTVRPRADLERLLGRAYGERTTLDRLMPGFRVVAAAFDENNLCLAQIAAVQMRVPDLPDLLARRGMEAEDLLIKRARGGDEDDRLARTGWDPAEHPRAGVPPNPGWFAPTDGAGGGSTQVAQGEDERAPEEMLDPLAPVRQAQWDAASVTLRQLDPGNRQLLSIAGPNWVPSAQDVAGINAEIRSVVTKRVADFVMPGGNPIGNAGSGRDIRVVTGGATAANKAFQYLSVGGTNVTPADYAGTLIQLPGNAGYVGLRFSESGPAVDVNVPGIPYRTLHY